VIAAHALPQISSLPSDQVARLFHPRLLLQLARKPTHGYVLMDALSQPGFVSLDPGNLYRILLSFEVQRLVRSHWDTQKTGPSRRIYTLTSLGRGHLHS
jgi:PadR family transcriptional regulator, regulatory protein PadR